MFHGVLSDYDGEPWFYTGDVARFVSKKGYTWLKCRPITDILVAPRYPTDIFMMALPDVLHVLQYPKTPRSQYLLNLLENEHVIDLPFHDPCHVVKVCDRTEGIPFPMWLQTFKKDYGLG